MANLTLLSDLHVSKNSKFLFIENIVFPENPTIGQLAFVEGVLYIYSSIKSVDTWYPLTNQKKSYIHVQGVSSSLWTINHNLESETFIFMIYDNSGNLIFSNPSEITINSFKLYFTSAFTGKVIVFADYDQDYNPNETQGIFDALLNIDGAGTGLDSDLLDAQHGSYYLDWYNFSNKPTTLTGYGITDAVADSQTMYIGTTSVAINRASAALVLTGITSIDGNAATASAIAWSGITSKPTTILGYGISDAYNKTEADNKYALKNGSNLVDFSIKNLTSFGNIIPDTDNVYDIGSDTLRFRTIYATDLKLSVNSLYLGDTKILGTEATTVLIKTDIGQNLSLQTNTGILEAKTVGANSNINFTASGTGSRVQISSGSSEVNISGTQVTATGELHANNDLSVAGNATITGNLTVNGTTFTANTTTVNIEDNIIVINSGQVGSGVSSGTAGFQIDRGDIADYQLVFDESDDFFKIGVVGSLETIATRNWVSTTYASTVTPGTYTKTTVNDKGLVTSGTSLASSDVTTALGFTPANTADVNVTDGNIISSTTSTSSTTQVVIATFAAATTRSVEFQIQGTSGSNYTFVRIAIIHNGTAVSMSEYGNVVIGSDVGVFDADINSGNLRLLFTPASAVSTTVKLIATAIDV